MFMVLLGYRNAPGGLRRKYGDDSIGAIPRVFRTFSLSTAPHFKPPALGRFQRHLLRIVNVPPQELEDSSVDNATEDRCPHYSNGGYSSRTSTTAGLQGLRKKTSKSDTLLLAWSCQHFTAMGCSNLFDYGQA